MNHREFYPPDGGSNNMQRLNLTIIAVLAVLSLFALINWRLLTIDPLVWPDEATITNIAQHLLTRENIATELVGQVVPGITKHAYIYPPLYFLLLAGWIHLAGSGIEAVRILPTAISTLTLIICFCLFVSATNSKTLGMIGTLLLSLDIGFGRAARIGRMEAATELWITLALLMFIKNMRKQSTGADIVCGIFVGLAVMTHFIGLSMLVILWLAVFVSNNNLREKIKTLVRITMPTLIFMGSWLLSMGDSWPIFAAQMRYQFMDKGNYGPYLMQLFHEPATAALAVIYLAMFGSYLLYLRKHATPVNLVVAIGFVVMLVAQLVGKIMWYFVYLEPWGILMLLLLMGASWQTKYRLPTLLLLLGLLGVSIWNQWDIMAGANRRPAAYHNFASNIARHIPRGKTVLITSIPDPYFDLQSNGGLTLREFPTGPIPLVDYEHFMEDVDVVVMNFIPIAWFENYVEANKKSVIPVRQPDNGYETNVVFLVPKNLRRSVIGN